MSYLVNLRYEDVPSSHYLTDLFNSVQLKDIVKRNKVRDVDFLEQILTTNEKYYIADHGIRDNFPKYVVSLDEFDMSCDGIKHMNIREFLLTPEWK